MKLYSCGKPARLCNILASARASPPIAAIHIGSSASFSAPVGRTNRMVRCPFTPTAISPLSSGGGKSIDQERASRSEEHTSELQSLMRISYAVFCLKKQKKKKSIQSLKEKENHKEH